MKRLYRFGRVAVLDGAKAMFLKNMARPPEIDLKLEKEHSHHNPPTRELGSERPPRTNDSTGHRSSMDAPDYHQMAEDKFAASVAAELAADLEAGAYEQLVIVAPPVALAALRKSVSAAVKQATILEIDKDLTKHAPKDIGKIVAKALEDASA